MKVRISCLLSCCLIIIPLVLAACSDTTPAEPPLTDEQIQAIKDELAERGGSSVFTLEAAAAVAGFPVAVPRYIPDGFYRQERIVINQLGGGLPAEMRHDNSPTMVDTYYFWEEDEKVMFFIEQSNGNPGMANAEPTQLCGGPGEKGYQPADPRRKYPSEILNIGTRIGDYHFFMYATLAGPLDEETIEKILCSVKYD
jgi:hypothetical protein